MRPGRDWRRCAGRLGASDGARRSARSILEAAIPYDGHATAEYLGAVPDNYCSEATAEALATRAFERAGWLDPTGIAIGLACTASLATDCPKRGAHHAHIACRTSTRMTVWSVVLRKDVRDREAEDDLVSRLLLKAALAETREVSGRLELALLPGEEVQRTDSPLDRLARFCRGELPAVHVARDWGISEQLPARPALLAGAFNPVHEGHWGIAAAAARRLGREVMFELSIRNVDKPSLNPAEVRRRANQFAWRAPVVLTAAPTFVEKASSFFRRGVCHRRGHGNSVGVTATTKSRNQACWRCCAQSARAVVVFS